jgi:hypothetical protein
MAADRRYPLRPCACSSITVKTITGDVKSKRGKFEVTIRELLALSVCIGHPNALRRKH